jgi:hypothetical protein
MKKKDPPKDRLKPRKETAKPRDAGNKRLDQQTRKLLGKHYASKYRVR